MDASVIVAAVGSFVVSERVLKPKATALFLLGCVLVYDLTTKTHDTTSLRVYRGPALVAFTLMMCAYSLRTWRRNGVACDELLFLPGTAHGQNHGIDSPLIELPPQPTALSSLQNTNKRQTSAEPLQRQQQQQQQQQAQNRSSEGDVAAGGFSRSSSSSFRQRRAHSEDGEDMLESSQSLEASESSAAAEQGEGILKDESSGQEEEEPFQVDPNGQEDNNNDEQALLEMNPQNRPTPPTSGTRLERWTNNHPLVTRLGTFFFFRSNNDTTTQTATYAPSGPTVFGAALDLSMPVLFNFHLFIEAYVHMQSQGDEIPAKILPIIFLSVLIVRTMVPPGKRGRFWGTLKFTFMAPLHRVRFRDAFIGDVLTSLVRPSQDLFFALSYYCTVIWGTVSGQYGLTQSGELLEQSFLLHNVILPSCAILPLWWKYLQTLRQAHDANRRWPYQGNSLKYLTSSLVIIYGMTHPEDRRSSWWLCFCFLTLGYQIWWDVIMDWELFEISPDDRFVSGQDPWWFAQISSLRPSSHILLVLQMYILQPLLDTYQRLRASTPNWRQIQLRSKRLYKTESFYWKIFFFNAFMRFTWMLCFIPAYHFNDGKRTIVSSSDVNSYLGVLLPVAEIVRRTLWGFLTLEQETLRMMDSDAMYSRVDVDEEEEEEDDNSKTEARSFRTQLLPTWLDNQQQVAHNAATSNAKQRDRFMRQLFVIEIYVWAGAFVALGCWAAS